MRPSAATCPARCADVVLGRAALDVPAAWLAMQRAARNDGARGPAAMAISAVDIALHDLRARLLGVPLATASAPSTTPSRCTARAASRSYDDDRLAEQLGGWAAQGIPRVKMKVGRDPAADDHRVAVARAAVGPETELYVDANGAYSRAQARAWARALRRDGRDVPGGAGDLGRPRGAAARARHRAAGAGDRGGRVRLRPGLRRAHGAAPSTCSRPTSRAAGASPRFLQSARSAGRERAVLGALRAGGPRPRLLRVQPLEHLECFHDHTRIERMLFDGTLEPSDGVLRPRPLHAPATALELRRDAVRRYAVPAEVESQAGMTSRAARGASRRRRSS